MTRYAIDLPRDEAVLYLSWEFGIARARALLAGSRPQNVTQSTGHFSSFIRLRFDTFLIPYRGRRQTKAAARAWRQRIAETVAWQRGRLKYRNQTCHAYVVEDRP